MSDLEPVPAGTLGLSHDDDDLEQPSTPSEDSSAASTPFEETAPEEDAPRRLPPGLRSVSDPRNMNPNSTPLGTLGMARKPSSTPFAGGISAENSVMAKARALHQQRMQKMAPVASSPTSPAQSPSPNGTNGFPGNFRMPNSLQRPGPGAHPKSSPAVPKPSLSERRAKMMKLPDMGGGDAGGAPNTMSLRRANAPKLSDITGDQPRQETEQSGQGSKMDDFKKYIDTEKGWITFDGAATITRTGVNFANGQTFSISLDEVEVLDELGKGNYGTVYKVKHAKPRVPRMGQGLSGVKNPRLISHNSDPIPLRSDAEAKFDPTARTTGVTMAMKEIRLELDDAKFTTILKELVILHECRSMYIIDFYGAFFQEGAVYICIEYMDGGSIDKLYSGGIPENVLRKITYSTVMGLKSLKDDHNIIHRDVKPTNILVNTDGRVKICDFGVSGNLVASIAKTNIGCQSYMAPERISGGAMAAGGTNDGTYSVQSDIWSLGLTIIECAMGRYPYPPEISSTIFSQLSAIVEGDPPDLPEEGYSDSARDFVKGCLHKVPKMRPTYAMLLKHPWISPLTKPATIAEEAEEQENVDDAALTDSLGKMDLGSAGDAEVAEWAREVLERKRRGDDKAGPSRPALHAAPLGGVSPLGSPAAAPE